MGYGSGGASRASVDAAIRQQRRKLHDSVRRRFARFGDEVLSIMLGFAFQPKRMPVLMQRLNIRQSGNLDAQLEAVWDLLAQSGSGEFLRKVKQRSTKEDVKAADIDLLSAGDLDLAAFQEKMGFTDDPPVVLVRQPEIVERRSGKDRRIGRDRRHAVDAISKNKRFGRDRRKLRRRQRKFNV